MAKQAVLNNKMKRNSSQREIRPIWNNVQRVNHHNQFVPTTVLTRTDKILVNTARHSFNRQEVLTSTAMKVNTVKSILNRDYPQITLQNKRIAEYQDFNGGPIGFRGSK
ncbi:hypothetical protein Tco_0764009, partial [Tanacetum coccineum]